MSTEQKRPKVGVSVIATSPEVPGCILLGVRKTGTGKGLHSTPGGHLEFGETWEQCARREMEEETGLRLCEVRYVTVVNDVNLEQGYHYVDIFVQAQVDSSHGLDPVNREPDKCEGWSWVPWTSLPPPEKLFSSIRVLQQEGFSPFE